MSDLWYRYEDIRYAPPLDEFDMPIGGGSVGIMLREYRVVKATPRGVWLEHDNWLFDPEPKFVLQDSRKRFACPTIIEAKESFIARKNKQIRILAEQLSNAKDALAKMQVGEDD